MCFHPQIPLENKSIFSGSLFQYLEENKKWRSRFLFVPDSYNINYYDSKAVRGKPKLPVQSVFRCCWFNSLFNMLTLLLVLTTSHMTNASVPKEPSTVPATKCWHLLSNTWTWSATACLVRSRVQAATIHADNFIQDFLFFSSWLEVSKHTQCFLT